MGLVIHQSQSMEGKGMEIKTCPFCGGEAKLITQGVPPSEEFCCWCTECMIATEWDLSKKYVIKIWNRRTRKSE